MQKFRNKKDFVKNILNDICSRDMRNLIFDFSPTRNTTEYIY